jgi:asparagine synthetase B (glutamine-hydrolysing)
VNLLLILLEFDKLQNIKQEVVGRDQIGIRPLYYSIDNYDKYLNLLIHEIKGMQTIKANIKRI